MHLCYLNRFLQLWSQTIFTPNQTNFWKQIFQANTKLAFMLRWSEGNVESGRRPANDILLLEYFDQISNGFNFQVTYQIYQEHLLVRQLCQEPRWALESWRRTRCSRGTYSQFVEDFWWFVFIFCNFLRLNIASNISAVYIRVVYIIVTIFGYWYCYRNHYCYCYCYCYCYHPYQSAGWSPS